MRRVAALGALLGVAAGLSEDYVRGNGALLWQNFKESNRKVYSAEEEGARYKVFMANMLEAAGLEKENPQARFGASPYADLSKEEFKAWHNLKVPKKASPEAMYSAGEVRAALATSVDWRSKGAVTQVKDQGQCGSCWAFSSTGGIEGSWFLAGNKLTSVSEQELVSCDKVDDGCNGGLMDNAYSYLVSKKGGAIVTEAAYPYTSGGGSTGSCKSVSGMAVGSTISGHKDITHTEAQMATYMSSNGPLPIAVDASSHWQTYTGGVVSSCSGTSLDHGVLIVGYTPQYWVVKNSWGSSWGESGYIRLAYGSNQCGLNQSPTAPLVSGSGPTPPSPPTPPTPSTPAPAPSPSGGSFTQKQCTDSACSAGCQSQSFPIGECLQVSGGGSAIVEACDSTGITMKTWLISSECSGALHTSSTQPTNQCLQDSQDTYFENLCSSASVSQGAVLRAENELAAIARAVNAAGAGWTAATPKRFGALKEAKALCGTWMADHPEYVALPEKNDSVLSATALPTDFDSRTQWPKCSVISKVRDQSSCGSCWAFGSTESFEDRRCVSTGEDVEFSTEDVAGCCSGFACGLSRGCGGGQPGAALSWMSKTGVVTGGDYTDIGTGSSCKPYTLAPCAHHVDPTPKYPVCPSSEYPTPKCTKSCSETSYSKDYSSDKTKASKAYSLSGETNIQNSILAKGPVSAAFTVYADFPTYKSGVYTHVSGKQLGGHAVEIVGWGVEAGTNYWLVKNSWNEEWGNGGFFKILRGSNECGIEGQINGVDF